MLLYVPTNNYVLTLLHVSTSDDVLTLLYVCVSPSNHRHGVETRLYCPQAFLSLDFQCKDDVSEFK